ncbi:hypothetical protein L596_023709 [Steinernema carpocapsae]|uniref:G-protein coupled receptors family 1 profile domain-containing protein n=1 Tax=Steinernema carpocapsae TaxID=34508 RepID=A0A4U5MEG0_STECR|nr:hypothetical protein L596_023709 [Steinernema carpocapsae]
MLIEMITKHPAYVTIKALLCVFTTLGNAFIAFTILKNKDLRKEKFNLLILTLAFGDIVIGRSNSALLFYSAASRRQRSLQPHVQLCRRVFRLFDAWNFPNFDHLRRPRDSACDAPNRS